MEANDYMKKYPNIVAHIICLSLGYATPTTAARILKDAKEGRENHCEWIWACYGKKPELAVNQAIRERQTHEGYMRSFAKAKGLVLVAISHDKEPVFASWF